MTITKLEKTIIPQTLEGVKFANCYERQLKEQHCFRARKEDTQAIIIEAEYLYILESGALENEQIQS